MTKTCLARRVAGPLLAAGLSGCVLLGMGEKGELDAAYGALARGNFAEAEQHADSVLSHDPREAQALLAKGIVCQQTGRLDKAREAFETIIRLNPTTTTVLDLRSGPQSVVEVARANLARLEEDTVPNAPAREAPVAVPLPAPPAMPVPAPAMAAPPPQVAPPRFITAPPPVAGMPSPGAGFARLSDALPSAVMIRFDTLRNLKEEGLITDEEMKLRREANIGALLPMTKPAPADGLNRPAPPGDQILGRLQALEQYRQKGLIPADEIKAERTTILNSLLPAQPRERAPAMPVTIDEVSRAIDRLERAKAKNLVTQPEYVKEKQALQSALDTLRLPPGTVQVAAAPEPPPKPKPQPKKPPPPPPPPPAAPKQPDTLGLQLATYKTLDAAEKAWIELKRANFDILGTLEHQVQKVELTKSAVYRLKIGPAPDMERAKELCGMLSERKVECQLVVMPPAAPSVEDAPSP